MVTRKRSVKALIVCRTVLKSFFFHFLFSLVLFSFYSYNFEGTWVVHELVLNNNTEISCDTTEMYFGIDVKTYDLSYVRQLDELIRLLIFQYRYQD